MKTEFNNNQLTLFFEGHIDSSNTAEYEKEINASLTENNPGSVLIEASNLEYISSAGLRVILKLKKKYPDLKIINVSSDVYEILEVTGFTEIIEVEKAYRILDVSGCTLMGEGANGLVYRYDKDTIVKVYKDANSLDDIKRERELARTAFIYGIPTAIPYDVVKVGSTYGSVFELLNAKSFDELMIEDAEGNFEFVASESIRVAKTMHSTDAPEGLPKQRDEALHWVKEVEEYFSDDDINKLRSLIENLPEDGRMLHGDFHIKNIMLQNGETLLIDMDTLCTGYPIYELAFMFNAYIGFGVIDRKCIEDFFKISADTARKLWNRMLELYCETSDRDYLDSVERKASLIGYLRIMRRSIRYFDCDTYDYKKQFEACRDKILEILPTIDDLLL